MAPSIRSEYLGVAKVFGASAYAGKVLAVDATTGCDGQCRHKRGYP